MKVGSWTLVYTSCFTVCPKKGKNDTLFSPKIICSDISANEIPDSLLAYFLTEPSNYPTGVKFLLHDGRNKVRDMVRKLVSENMYVIHSISQELANRLCHCMDNKSNSGLFVVMCGKKHDFYRIVFLKFPQETMINIHENNLPQFNLAYSLNLGYLKAVIFEDTISENSFCKARVDDKENTLANSMGTSYWINDFLLSEIDISDSSGTRILSNLIRDSINKATSLKEKQRIINEYMYLVLGENKNTSIDDFFKVSPIDFKKKIQFEDDKRLFAKFNFLPREAEKILGYEFVKLDNDITICGPAEILEEKFLTVSPDEDNISISGSIINKELRPAI